jgi:hypothetical protein
MPHASSEATQPSQPGARAIRPGTPGEIRTV